MKLPALTDNQIKSVFNDAGLDFHDKIEKIPVGYSNDIYSIDNKYILKSGRSGKDDKYLEKEIFVSNLLKGKVPVPEIVHFDTNKKIVDRKFIIYNKVHGDNLYAKWHTYSTEERKTIIKEICSFLRVINETPYDEFVNKFKIDASISWRERMLSMIEESKSRVVKQKSLTPEFIKEIERFVSENIEVLDKSRMALTYFDAHFDNFIVQGNKIVAMLDFERTSFLSVDYVLDTVQRMVTYPKKYPSEESEALVKDEDCKDLTRWYEEYYPELFDFPDMETRLKLYAIQDNLRNRYYWPNAKILENELREHIR